MARAPQEYIQTQTTPPCPTSCEIAKAQGTVQESQDQEGRPAPTPDQFSSAHNGGSIPRAKRPCSGKTKTLAFRSAAASAWYLPSARPRSSLQNSYEPPAS